jgi:hypothetical protein
MEIDTKEGSTGQNEQRYGYLIVVFTLVGLFVFVGIFSILLLIVLCQSDEPRQAVLRHPSGETIVAAAAREDLAKAEELAKQLVVSSLKGHPDTGRERIEDMSSLLASRRIVDIDNWTSCQVLESDGPMCKVQITEGFRKGQVYWINRNCVSYAQAAEYSSGYGAALLCFRYIITAVICGAGIYLLRTKSFFLKGLVSQIVCFIVGMLILNIIWIRIAEFLMSP